MDSKLPLQLFYNNTASQGLHFCNRSSCVVSSPTTTTSSIVTSTPSKSSTIRSMVLSNISGAHFTTKGSLVNLYWPMGVLNVHRREDSSSYKRVKTLTIGLSAFIELQSSHDVDFARSTVLFILFHFHR